MSQSLVCLVGFGEAWCFGEVLVWLFEDAGLRFVLRGGLATRVVPDRGWAPRFFDRKKSAHPPSGTESDGLGALVGLGLDGFYEIKKVVLPCE